MRPLSIRFQLLSLGWRWLSEAMERLFSVRQLGIRTDLFCPLPRRVDHNNQTTHHW
jgi:hypothetical protein